MIKHYHQHNSRNIQLADKHEIREQSTHTI